MSAQTATDPTTQDEIRRARKKAQQATARARVANNTVLVDTDPDYDEDFELDTHAFPLHEQMERSARTRQEEAQRQFRTRQVTIARQHHLVTDVLKGSLAEIVIDGVFNQYPTVYVARFGPNRTQCAADIVVKTINEMLGSKAATSAEVTDAIKFARIALRDSYEDAQYAANAEPTNYIIPTPQPAPLTQNIFGTSRP